MKKFLLLLLLFPFILSAQSQYEECVDGAVINAKKGIYWAFENIPEKKKSIEHDLISKDKLIAKVKLAKEVEGVRVESTGYFRSTKATVTLYRSYDLLKKEGYIQEKEKKE
ncbi:MAG: hypothetical protein GXO87_09525 [Chlorobi bacterium]|nr:hypothetical protein [Chlorobiota bacterium]